VPSAKTVALTVKLTTKLFTPASVGDASVLTSDSRSLRSSALVPEGRTLILGGLIANTDPLQPAKKQGKRRELLVLITPQLIG
jgi:type II secretory pathway component GspD/PulD (secretin)